MKNLKKRLIALGLGLATMASSVMSMSASALQYDPWPAYYVPYKGEFYADISVVCIRNIKWSQTQKTEIADKNPNGQISMEFEFRPQTPITNPHGIWSDTKGAMLTNIPGGSFEFQWYDPNDVSIVFPDLADLVPETSYYATQAMTPKPYGETDVTYNFECELGKHGIIDSNPIRCSLYPDSTSFRYWGQW